MQGLMKFSRDGMKHEKSPLLSRRHDLDAGDGRRQGDELDETTRLVSLPGVIEENVPSSSDRDDSPYLNVPDHYPRSSSSSSEIQHHRRGSAIDEMRRQSAVFFDDSDVYGDESDESTGGAWNKVSPLEKEI